MVDIYGRIDPKSIILFLKEYFYIENILIPLYFFLIIHSFFQRSISMRHSIAGFAVLILALVSFAADEIDSLFVIDSMQASINSLTLDLNRIKESKQTARSRAEFTKVQAERTRLIRDYSRIAAVYYPEDAAEHAKAYFKASKLLPYHQRLYRMHNEVPSASEVAVTYKKHKLAQ